MKKLLAVCLIWFWHPYRDCLLQNEAGADNEATAKMVQELFLS